MDWLAIISRMNTIDMNHSLKRLLFLQLKAYSRRLNERLIAQGITPRSEAQAEVLMVLNGGDCSISAIAEQIGVSRQATHKIVSFTEYGIAQRELITATISDIEQEIGKHIGKTAIAQLRDVLTKDWG